MATLADALRQFGSAYLATHALNTSQAKAWRGIVACRSAALGGTRRECDQCGHHHWQYHSCRNRHCPQCGMRAKDAWLQGRLAEVLDVPYVHLVFTLPHCLNALYSAHPRWVIDTLFACTAQTLTEFAANPKWMGVANGKPALSLVLHTWKQDLLQHLHVHGVMACGVLDQAGRWVMPARKPDFLFPVEALSAVFRGKFMQALREARGTGQLERDPHGSQTLWNQRQRQLYKYQWVVYAKTPLGGPAQVLEYLSRYTHRTAISNERIRSIRAGNVAFHVRSNDHGGKRLEHLKGEEFVRRFLLHILPTGLKRIRHYGVLASASKGLQLTAARQSLRMPQPNMQAMECAQDFLMRVARIDAHLCPCCKVGRLQITAVLRGVARLPAPESSVMPANRGPP
ncbi:MAG: IS91 family transposase [Burkholderiales bacterium PBB4]|nr:MAG: IS91 family transposase [Burkholderiales bacterium PBB4]